ncbi:MAG: nucleotide exchange factor GrpE [Verrucomicrobiota bacterium]|nr:nucleotide exchange factor GrpE [Opitutaceae bacterium]
MPETEKQENSPNPAAETKPADGAAQAAPDLPTQLAAAKAESAAHYDRFLRTAADLENFRRRALREKDELRTAATGRVLEDIFPVLDTLAMAAAAARQPGAELKGVADGVEMVLTQMRTALAGHGLKEVNPVGQAFDPHQHQAISHQASSEVKEESVVQVVRVGYSLNGRLLRPASVIVSSGPAKEAAAV